MTKDSSALYQVFLSGTIAIIVVGSGLYMWNLSQERMAESIELEQAPTSTLEMSSSTEEIVEEPALTFGYSINSPLWKVLLKGNVEEKISGEITNKFIPTNPEMKDVVYISTHEISEDDEEMAPATNTIAMYDAKTDELTTLYSEKEDRTLRILALQGDNVLIGIETSEELEPPCDNMWFTMNEYASLSLKNPATLSPYMLSEKMLEDVDDECLLEKHEDLDEHDMDTVSSTKEADEEK